jgi:hypothetical protein
MKGMKRLARLTSEPSSGIGQDASTLIVISTAS